ncbi:alanine racemase [Tissierella praeacuta]|uniref:alanine racemase n=1 Tax=Tissierella praeacuta TaxID=43131 RepID=UPI00104960CC|nr:alanine racemase [Tissierella praeacuta]TCU71682.1 alanine racemase [Tissierella praeacuta]
MLKNCTDSLMRNTWVEIDLSNLEYNLSQARKMLKSKTKIAGVVKANAYGHGSIHIAKALIENGIDMLAVACLTEAIELRKYYSDIPILIMGYTPSDKLKFAVQNNITITIFSLEQAIILSDIGEMLNKEVTIHIKIETGFNRLGLKIDSNIISIIEKIYNLKNIRLEGIFTHFALKTKETDKIQYELLMNVIHKLEAKGIYIPIKHICDSIGMVIYPEYHLDMIRLGSLMYGVQTSSKKEGSLRSVMTFKTEISQVKEIQAGEGVGYDYSFVAKKKTIVGTLPVGYADGYMRALTGKGEVNINGKRAPIIGKICMDQCMIDLTNIPYAKVGDEVILLAGNSKDGITLDEVAEKINTNRNEVLSVISRRVPRVYIKKSKPICIVDYLLD